MKFRDRTILVTGASRGIGAALAKAFAAEGGLVVVNYRSNEALRWQVVEACEALGGQALAIAADVTSEAEVGTMLARIADEVGRLDAVVNNAFAPYVFDPDNRTRFWDTPWSAYQAQIDGALKATYNVCQAVLPLMKQRRKAASSTWRAISSRVRASPITTTPRRKRP
jgi:3-oxoacyl-[acyl-carrier protein] reductase